MTVPKKLVTLLVGIVVLVGGYFGIGLIELDAEGQAKAVEAVCKLATCVDE